MRSAGGGEGRAGEAGYAALAALLAAAMFATVALQIARTTRSGVVGVNALAVQARLDAASEAGIATALDHVLAADAEGRWEIDGAAHDEPFGDGGSLRIAVEDERGKAPLNSLSQAQAQRMFALAGAGPSEAAALADSFIRWRDPPDVSATGGVAPPAAPGEHPAADFRTVDELRLLPGLAPAVFAALAPYVTTDTGDARFDPRFASDFAKEVIGQRPLSPFDAILKQREAEGERTALSTAAAPPVDLVGRVLTVRVLARDSADGRLESATVVELTGRPDRPFLVRRRSL